MFVIIAAVLVIIVLFLIAWPLFWNSKRPPLTVTGVEGGNESADLEIEKENILTSLRDMESDLQGGTLSQTDYERLKDIDEHRLAGILDRIDSATADAKETTGSIRTANTIWPSARFRTMNIAGLIILVLLVAGGASGVYYYQNVKLQEQNLETMMENQTGTAMDGSPNPLEMVARLERKLRENPDDLQGQMMAARSYMTIHRTEDAKKAWSKVIELDPANVEAQYSLGYLMIETADSGDPRSFEQAIRQFDAALLLSPGLPAALYYKGVALTHLKRYDEAEKSWETALQGLPPGSEDAEFVKDALRKLKSGNR